MNINKKNNMIDKLKRKWLRMNQREEQKIWQKKVCKRSPINMTKLSRQKLFSQRNSI